MALWLALPAQGADAPFSEPLAFSDGQTARCRASADGSVGYLLAALGGRKVRLSAVIGGAIDPDEKSLVMDHLPSGADDLIYLAKDVEARSLPMVSRTEIVLFKRSAAAEPLNGILQFSELYLATRPDGTRYVESRYAGGSVTLSACEVR